MTDRAGQYVEECGTLCPHCREGVISRDGRWFVPPVPPPDSQRVLTVPCMCMRCGGEWHEIYRLESVKLGKPGRGNNA